MKEEGNNSVSFLVYNLLNYLTIFRSVIFKKFNIQIVHRSLVNYNLKICNSNRKLKRHFKIIKRENSTFLFNMI